MFESSTMFSGLDSFLTGVSSFISRVFFISSSSSGFAGFLFDGVSSS